MYLFHKIFGFFNGCRMLLSIFFMRHFGGYGFSFVEEGAPYWVIVYSYEMEDVMDEVNDPDFFTIDYSGETARIRTNPEHVQHYPKEKHPYQYGVIGKHWYTGIFLAGETLEDLEDGINEYMSIVPFDDGVEIVPPRGFRNLDKENFLSEDEY